MILDSKTYNIMVGEVVYSQISEINSLRARCGAKSPMMRNEKKYGGPHPFRQAENRISELSY